jgi:hypothetical protein
MNTDKRIFESPVVVTYEHDELVEEPVFTAKPS